MLLIRENYFQTAMVTVQNCPVNVESRNLRDSIREFHKAVRYLACVFFSIFRFFDLFLTQKLAVITIF